MRNQNFENKGGEQKRRTLEFRFEKNPDEILVKTIPTIGDARISHPNFTEVMHTVMDEINRHTNQASIDLEPIPVGRLTSK